MLLMVAVTFQPDFRNTSAAALPKPDEHPVTKTDCCSVVFVIE